MTNLTRWDPFREMLAMRNVMDRMFDRSLTAPSSWTRDWDLALDVLENEDEFTIKASIPGMKPEDLEITLDNRTLTIKGDIQEENITEEEGRYHLRERRFGTFSRSLSLPSRVDAENIDASYDSGVLTLHIPKAEEAKPKRISVKSGEKILEG